MRFSDKRKLESRKNGQVFLSNLSRRENKRLRKIIVADKREITQESLLEYSNKVN